MRSGTIGEVISLDKARERLVEKSTYQAWLGYYSSQPHEQLLEALVHEHENDFPMRKSAAKEDRLRHQALIEALNERAQTQFLKNLLHEISLRDHAN